MSQALKDSAPSGEKVKGGEKLLNPEALAKKITESKNLQAEIDKIEDNLDKSRKALEVQKK